MLTDGLIGFLLSLGVATAGFRAKSLSLSGWWAAVLVGTAVFSGGRWEWGSVVGVFFGTCSGLSHIQSAGKRAAAGRFQKGPQRDAVQVLANGGLAAIAAVGTVLAPGWDRFWYGLFLGSLATATADTWGTEIGLLTGRQPRHIVTWRRVEAGVSGGITLAGSTGGGLGALVLGGTALAAAAMAESPHAICGGWLPGIAAISGLLGSVIDSVLGAAAQARFRCRCCGCVTEVAEHCGCPALLEGGWRWMNNDLVNLLAVAAGGGAGGILIPVVC